MKKYYAEMQLDSGSIRVEFEAPDMTDDDDIFDRAVAQIEKELNYCKLDFWGEA